MRMSESESDFNTPAAAAFIMDTQLVGTRRATQVASWVQMVILGVLYGVIGLAILLAGDDFVTRWFAYALVGAVGIGSTVVMITTRGVDGPRAALQRTLHALFLTLLAALAVAVGMIPAGAHPAGMPLGWFAVIASVMILVAWAGAKSLLMRTGVYVVIVAGVGAALVVVVLLLLLLPTDRPAAISVVIGGALAVIAAIPVRRRELRNLHADPTA